MRSALMRTIVAIMWFFCFSMILLANAQAQNYSVKMITSGDYDKKHPDINNKGQIVWSGFDGSHYQIYLYQKGKAKNITKNTLNNYWPFINNKGAVVYYGCVSDSDMNVYYYKGKTTKIAPFYSRNPRMNDSGDIVWKGWNGNKDVFTSIFLYKKKFINQISPNDIFESYCPDINNKGQIVYAGDYGIYLYDGSATQLIMDYGWFPRINDNGDLAFADSEGGIYLWNKDDLFVLSGAKLEWSLDLNNNGQLVWSEFNEATQTHHVYVSLSVYDDNYCVSKNTFDNLYPCINDQGQIVWSGRVTPDSPRQIFLATPQ